MITSVLAVSSAAIKQYVKYILTDNFFPTSEHEHIYIISISGTGSNPTFPIRLIKNNIMSVTFDKANDIGHGKLKFNALHAMKIIDFLEKIKTETKPGLLIIESEEGISRSGSIAMFACKYYEVNEEQFYLENQIIVPDEDIINLLIAAKDKLIKKGSMARK